MNEEDKKIIKHYWLYVLQLEQGKYYIGVTASTPERRFKQHLSGFAGARWTRKYKPLEIIDRIDLGEVSYLDAEIIENKRTREYMQRFGLNNVRGGDLTEGERYINIFNRAVPVSTLPGVFYFVGSVLLITLLLVDKIFF